MNDVVKIEPIEESPAIEASALTTIEKSTSETIEEFGQAVIDSGMNQVDELNAMGLKDKLSNGLYARVLTIPKGAFIIGRIHVRPYIDIFISGDVTVKSFLADDTVEEVERINSFRFFEGKQGRRRVLYAHEETTWVTVDPTLATKVEEAEDEITVCRMQEYTKLLEAGK